MGISVFPAPSAASKTRFVVNLLSGTSWTVPTGVTYIIATLIGGGGGASGDGVGTASGTNGQVITSTFATTPGASIAYSIGAGGATGNPASNGGSTTMTGATTATGGNGASGRTAGAPVNNTGAGGLDGNGGAQAGQNTGGQRPGASGRIDIEYWNQEITMRTFAVIKDNVVVNIIVGVEDEVVAANPDKYIEYTNGWDYNNGIDGGVFFPIPEEPVEEPTE